MKDKQPMQPVIEINGIATFKKNSIVEYLLDNGGIDMNKIASLDFPREDREQFAQLIGYTLGGYSELSYVSDESYETAVECFNTGKTELEARCDVLTSKLDSIKEGMKHTVSNLYGIHPDDL